MSEQATSSNRSRSDKPRTVEGAAVVGVGEREAVRAVDAALELHGYVVGVALLCDMCVLCVRSVCNGVCGVWVWGENGQGCLACCGRVCVACEMWTEMENCVACGWQLLQKKQDERQRRFKKHVPGGASYRPLCGGRRSQDSRTWACGSVNLHAHMCIRVYASYVYQDMHGCCFDVPTCRTQHTRTHTRAHTSLHSYTYKCWLPPSEKLGPELPRRKAPQLRFREPGRLRDMCVCMCVGRAG